MVPRLIGETMTTARNFARVLAAILLPVALCVGPTWLAIVMGW